MGKTYASTNGRREGRARWTVAHESEKRTEEEGRRRERGK